MRPALSKKCKKIRIVERDLSEEEPKDCWGFAHPNGLIELDFNQKPKRYLTTLIHELLHQCFPYMSEEKVTAASLVMGHHVWRQRYRRIMK